MTVTVGALKVDLDLSAIGFDAKLTAALAKTGRFNAGASRDMAAVRSQVALATTSFSRLNAISLSRIRSDLLGISTAARGLSSLNIAAGLRGLAAGAGIGLGAAGAQQLIDATTRIDNALKTAGFSGRELDSVYKSLYASAQRTAAPVESLVTLFGRASLVQKELGVSTQELLKFTGNIATALQVNGKSAMESAGALTQLSQALGSGTVRAEEFNSIQEGALPILQAVAAGITETGGSVAKLRQLVIDGKVSSTAFFRGFEAGAGILQDKVANAQLTVAQGFTKIHNAAIDTTRRINEASGASNTAASALDGLAIIVNKLGDALVYLAKQGGESGTTKAINDIGAAARNLVNDPSFENLYKFLFDASKSQAQAQLTDGIRQRAAAIDLLRQSMQAANAEAERGSATGMAPNKRIDEAFASFAPKKVSLSQFPVTGKDSSAASSVNAEADAFTRAADAISRRTAVLQADLATTGMSEAARERARVVAELEVAAIKANTAAGLENTSVTEAQRGKIEELATAFENVKGKIESANSPLQQWIRESANIKANLEGIAVSGLDRMADELTEVTSGAKTAGEAMKSLADVVIKEVQRMIIKMALAAMLKAFIGGGADGGLVGMGGIGNGGGLIGSVFGGGTGFLHTPGGFSGAFPSPFKNGGLVTSIARAGKAMAEGGKISGPGGPRSDSILAALSNGEFVVNAAQTKKHRALLEAINSGISLSAMTPAFANGGAVGFGLSTMNDTPYLGEIGGKGAVLQ